VYALMKTTVHDHHPFKLPSSAHLQNLSVTWA
jgi:hypothetical protein